MKTAVQIITIFFLYSLNVSSQTDSLNNLFSRGISLAKEAYLKYDKEMFLEARSFFEKAYESDKSSLFPLYYKTLIDYKILELATTKGDQELFDRYYESSLKNAEILSNSKIYSANGKILSASIYMMKIALSSLSAVTLSPRIHSLLDDAQQIDPKNPYSYVVRGIMKYQTPGFFGGSYQDALKNFNYAVKLFEDKQNYSIKPVWGFIETLAWLGKTHEQLDNKDAAVFTYKKALLSEPEFGWIKYSLLPKLTEENQ